MNSKIPFYVVCFNRIDGLKYALEFVNSSSLSLEMVILDMGSTWNPFIKYRDSLGVRVESFPKGMGPRDLWVTGVIKKLGDGPFFLADGDIDYSGLPSDTASALNSISEKYPWFPKVGLALTVKDLPKDAEGTRVLKWELDNWKVRFADNLYLNGVDTTIAFYPRRESIFYYRPSLRLGGIYTARHYPWYEREETFNEEAKFYYQVAGSSISSTQASELPSRKYRAKHSLLIFIYWLLRKPLKLRLFGKFCVQVISYKGKIKSI
jgi:hypothetical protein